MKTLILALLLACGGAEAPHRHDHEGEGAHAHDAKGDHAHDDAHHDDHHGEAKAEGGAMTAPLGAYTARLEPSADALKLVVTDADGKPVAAEGEAKVMLTGTGEEAQKLVLAADGEAWTGAAKAEGAPGYLALVSVSVGGHEESARLTWGEVPEQKAAPEPHDHGDGGHDHGDGGHGHDH
ncbi:MAG: hypothetical protein EP330_07795 [Deltaproteobacteria bacterium]|nr:MAG: hypothetical protein EP330_07795 [Deltaproteobacteria bacterium]